MVVRSTLSELLERPRLFDPEYRGGLSDHLPMALVALSRMGASPERLRSFARHYERRLEPAAPAGQVLSTEAWRRHLGHRAHYPDFLATFQRSITPQHWPEVLRDLLPVLMPGCAAAAFHPLIRLSFAIETQTPSEMAIALAYWASRFLRLGGNAVIGQPPLSPDPKVLLRHLAEERAFKHRPDQDSLIDAEMKRATCIPEFAPVTFWLEIVPDTVQRLARTVLEIYAATADFTVLHMVTAVQAARSVLPYCGAPEPATRYLWQAIAAAYLSIGKPAIPDMPPLDAAEAPEWPAILSAACEAEDEHVIKIVYSCWAEDAAYNDPLYRAVAARAIQ
jgi:hypothetical protein